jgi:quinol monooxygenase YgiN
MFGTIGRARLKAGKEDAFKAVGEDWVREIRPQIPGRVVQLMGKSTDHPDEIMFIALMQDESTYRNLAEMPEQHAYFERFSALAEDEIRWEDVELDVMLDD